MKTPKRHSETIVDQSGQNLDEAVVNILNDLAHAPRTMDHLDQAKRTDSLDSFFDITPYGFDDL